jgi:carboxypeptidase family protein
MHRPNLAPIRILMRIAVLHCCLVIGGVAFAQQPLGNLAGAVTDPSGSVVRGATVTATSLATGALRVTTTNDQGYFLLPTLQAGEYKAEHQPRRLRQLPG